MKHTEWESTELLKNFFKHFVGSGSNVRRMKNS